MANLCVADVPVARLLQHGRTHQILRHSQRPLDAQLSVLRTELASVSAHTPQAQADGKENESSREEEDQIDIEMEEEEEAGGEIEEAEEAEDEADEAPAPAASSRRVSPRADPVIKQARPGKKQRAASEYELPPLTLLAEPKKNARAVELSPEALEQNARALEGVLEDFGVRGQIVNVRPGPVVTLYVAGILSANLAVVNALPFPPLDGGRMLIITLKSIFGKRISLQAERLTYLVGFVFLFAFLIWITGFDILRGLTGGS